MTRHSTRRWLCVGAAAAAASVPLLPFLRSGERMRSGYELVRTASSVGAIDSVYGRAGMLALAALPVIAAAALLAAVARATMVVAGCTAVAGAIAAVAGVAAWRSPIEMEAGAWTAMAVGGTAMTMAIAVFATSLRAPKRTP